MHDPGDLEIAKKRWRNVEYAESTNPTSNSFSNQVMSENAESQASALERRRIARRNRVLANADDRMARVMNPNAPAPEVSASGGGIEDKPAKAEKSEEEAAAARAAARRRRLQNTEARMSKILNSRPSEEDLAKEEALSQQSCGSNALGSGAAAVAAAAAAVGQNPAVSPALSNDSPSMPAGEAPPTPPSHATSPGDDDNSRTLRQRSSTTASSVSGGGDECSPRSPSTVSESSTPRTPGGATLTYRELQRATKERRVSLIYMRLIMVFIIAVAWNAFRQQSSVSFVAIAILGTATCHYISSLSVTAKTSIGTENELSKSLAMVLSWSERLSTAKQLATDLFFDVSLLIVCFALTAALIPMVAHLLPQTT